MKATRCITLVLSVLLASIFTVSALAQSKPAAMAIDILLNPDETMIAHAKAANARLLEDYPHGFALDAAHTPHVSLLQRYVRSADLEQVKAAVSKVIAQANPATLELQSTGYYYIPYKGLGLVGITVAATDALLDLQQKLIEATAPFVVERGTGEAFVQRPDGRPIIQPTVDYVNAFVPEHSGKKFNPHVTVGLGEEAFVKKLLAEPFQTFTFRASAASIVHLGEYGTAQKELWASGAAGPLPSWNEGKAKQSIIEFVTTVTKPGSSDFVPITERIAVFDNDGTLWAEQPMYFQLLFALDRVQALAPQHPEWKAREPFASLLKGDVKGALVGGERAMLEIAMAAHAGMTTEEFEMIVRNWLATAKHPKTGRRYTEMVYQPMLELLNLLRANGFKTFIVSGGGIEFMRPWTEKVYGIPPEQVVGSSIKTKFEMHDGTPVLMRLPELNFIDDNTGKPVGIHQHIGRRPIAAFGNSDGDLQMLQWTCTGSGSRFCLYVRHTDAEREWAYDRESHIGKLDKGLDEAKAKGWTVVSMKEDWKKIFPFEK